MKYFNCLFICLFSIFFLSCAQGAGKKPRMVVKGEDKTEVSCADNGGEALSGGENFDQFIQKFSTQKSFQLQRVKFPIGVIIPDTGHEGMAPREETIGRYDWEVLDLTYDSTYQTRPYDQYYQNVRYERNDTAVVEIRGIDNGIYADYYFTLIDKKWYLVTLYEASF